MILVNPQWQGGADFITYKAADFIEKKYLKGYDYHVVPVDVSDASKDIDNNIIGYSSVKKQTEKAYSILKSCNADKVFTIGGGCDADVASILYLNEVYNGDLAVLWFDAHGDINSPDESDTHLFYGMPVRAMLGECGGFPLKTSRWLQRNQVINIGGRDLDTSEIEFMQKAGIQRISTEETDIFHAIQKAVEKVRKKHIYIHFDLDVLDPSQFSATPVPTPNGIKLEGATRVLRLLKEEFHVVGFGLYEYYPELDTQQLVKQFVDYGLEL